MLLNVIMRLDVSHDEVLWTRCSLRVGLSRESLAVGRAAHHAKHDSEEEVSFTSARRIVSIEDIDLLSLCPWGTEALLIVVGELSTVDSGSPLLPLWLVVTSNGLHWVRWEDHIINSLLSNGTIFELLLSNHLLFLSVEEPVVYFLDQLKFKLVEISLVDVIILVYWHNWLRASEAWVCECLLEIGDLLLQDHVFTWKGCVSLL